MFENWSIRKKIIIALINFIILLFLIGLIATPIGRSPDIDSSFGSAIFYLLTIVLPILLIRYSDKRKVKILSSITIMFAVIMSLLFVVYSPRYTDAKRNLVYSYVSKNLLNYCEAQSAPGLYVVGNVDACRYSLYKNNVNSIRFVFNEINLRIYALYHVPEDFLTLVGTILLLASG